MDDLFDPERMARRTDPATSHAAAESMRDAVGRHHRLILGALDVAERLSAQQIADRTDIDYVAVGKRTSELIDAGLIERNGTTHTNRSGRDADQYRLTERGRAETETWES